MNGDLLTLDEYRVALDKISEVFNTSVRLPDFVFKRRYRFFLMCEFDNVMNWRLVEFLKASRLSAHSPQILVSVLDPDPIGYFYKHFKKINSFYFGPDTTRDEYVDLLCYDPGNWPDAIFYNSEVVTWIPSGGNWAIWGERSEEIAVVGLDDSDVVKYLIAVAGNWMDAETALENFACIPFIDQKVPEDFRHTLIANYGSRTNLEKKLGQKVEYLWEK